MDTMVVSIMIHLHITWKQESWVLLVKPSSLDMVLSNLTTCFPGVSIERRNNV